VIRVERRGPVLLATIDRPERRNAVDVATLVALRRAVDEAARRARVLVVIGAGGCFCAGADLTGVHDDGFAASLADVLTGLTELAIPVLAAVDGPALGAGIQLAAACDFRVATARSRFGVPAARLGLVVDAWTVRRLAEELGHPVARAMLVGAVPYPAEHLLAPGFVHRIGGLDEALAWAEELAELAPLTMAAHKRGLAAVTGDEATAAEFDELRARAWASADAHEGRVAFLEKRSPRFTGA